MKKTVFLLIPFFVILYFVSCTKDIIIKPIPYVNQLSVECILYPNKVPQLFLSNSVEYFSASSTPQQLFVRGASATISSGSIIDILTPDSTFDNFRCRWVNYYKGTIPAQIGQSYTLTIVYDGKTYSATTTINQPAASLQSVSYISSFHDIYGDHEGVVMNFNDQAGSQNYYRFQMNRMIDSSVYGASNLGLIHSTCTNGASFRVSEFGRSIYSDKNLDGQGLVITIEPAFKHHQDDSTYVMIQSLDINSGEFFDNLDKQMQANLNPFVEPVFLKTKIDGCIGVFGSAVTSDSLLFVYPE